MDANKKTKTRNPHLRQDYHNVDTLLAGLNGKYPQIKLESKGLSRDTLYTAIADAQYLTEQIGTAGSEQYIAQAVLNLSAVHGVYNVRIDFAPGSHADPDVWSQKSFDGYREIK